MDIQEYLAAEDITQQKFADDLGVSQPMISQMISGKTRITAEMAKHIEEVTEGGLKRSDLRPDLFETAVVSS